MNQKHSKLTEVIEYSETMLREAESGNWKNVFTIEEQRSELIKEIYSQPSTTNERLNNNRQIMQILVLNKKIEAITSRARDNVRDQAGSINKGRQAVEVYAQNVG
ncbi:MAG TPA: flagellar protein FliT [Gammaproteobacteria bacterium]|nr:flagellar protein FliT [Gammaproteobacteria bacterium]